MPSPNEYREHAAQVLKLAQSAADDEDRACLVALAHLWTKLAEEVERRASSIRHANGSRA
jgi:hypothetical protein